MQVIPWYIAANTVYLLGLWLQQRYGWYTKIANLAWDAILWCWRAMMRHTGDPSIDYKPRRYA